MMKRRRVLILAAAATACACAVGFAVDTRAMLQSWLFAWLFALGVTLGALANLMVHTLTGGAWGELLRPPLIAAARTMPAVALLALPLLAGFRLLLPWAGADAGVQARWWFNEPFFLVRSTACLGIWL